MLNFININATYQPYMDSGNLLINLSQNPDYMNLSGKLLISIKDKLIEMYKIGFIFKPDLGLVSKWQLVPHDIVGGDRNYLSVDLTQDIDWNNQSIKTVNYLTNYDTFKNIPYDNLLYKANWKDNRLIGNYTYMTDFLISRMKGETDLNISLETNFLDKHEISLILRKEGLSLDDFIFDENGITFPTGGKDYITAKKYTDIVYEYIANKQYGREVEIGFLKAVRLEEFDNVKEGIIYRTDDQERPFTASFLNE